MLLFWIKGRRLKFNSDEWNDFLLSLPFKKVQAYGVGIYFTAAAVSSALTYFALVLIGYRHSFIIASLLFVSGLIISAFKYQAKGKDYLAKRYQEIPKSILEAKRNGGTNKMNDQIILRTFQKTDRPALENVVREAWKYDRFCTPKTASKMARVYLNSCLINQTFTQVAVINDTPVGIIMGKNIQKHKCPLTLRIKWMASIISLYISKEGREISKIFECVQGIDKELLSRCGKEYKGELAFFAISEQCRGKGLGRKLFETAVDYMRSQNIPEFYLFTDTSCNYPFYEHIGLMRRIEKKQVINVKGEKGDMTFFIYDYQC